MLIDLSASFKLPLDSLVSPSLNSNTYNEFAMVEISKVRLYISVIKLTSK